MKALVIATTGSKALRVLSASIDAYTPKDLMVYIATPTTKPNWYPKNRAWVTIKNVANNYGDAYNAVVHKAFENHNEIIVANDDIVLTPDSYSLLEEDVRHLKAGYKTGWVVAKADYVRGSHSILYNSREDCYPIQRCSPLFGYISKDAWVDYAPINWYSDDVQCIDMISKGCQHFVSRSYVHHAGSQTIGKDDQKNHLDSEEWIKNNRPELHREWYK